MLAGVTIYVYLHRAAFAEMFGTWGSPGWFFVYMGNLPSALYGRFPGGTGDLFNPLWSLQIEEQFYLLFPMCVRFLSTPALKRFLWAAVILSPCLRLLGYFWDPTNWVSAYVLLPCRMEGLALGSLIALRFREGAWPISRKKISVLTVFWLAAASIFTVSNGVVLQQPSIRILGYTISSIAGAHLVMWLISFRGTKLTTCLRSKPIQHMGLISYGLYLLHMPVALMLKLTVGPLLGIDLSGGVPRLVAVMATTIGLASLSWYWVESPAVKLKDRWFPRRA
jgi:peptidoglycan/LPS O-acetylase OafA/YrhL